MARFAAGLTLSLRGAFFFMALGAILLGIIYRGSVRGTAAAER